MTKRNDKFDARTLLQKIADGRSPEYVSAIEEAFESAVSDEEQDAWDAAFELRWLAPSVDGAQLIVAEDRTAWQIIHLALKYEMLSHVLCTNRFESGESPVKNEFTWIELNRGCHWLCYTIATCEDRFANWWGSRLLKNLREQNALVKASSWHAFESFTAKLYAVWQGEQLKLTSHPTFDLGVYKCVFDAWEDEAAFADAVRTVCDYHCQDIGDDDGPFTSFPFSVIPAEIGALMRVRRDLGMPTPEIKHPLLDSAFAKIPSKVEPITDDRVDRVLAKCREENPAFAPPW